MANPIVHPEAEYTIASIGPDRQWDFNTDSGKIAMKTYSIQVEGIADWMDINYKADGEAPKVGDKIEGHVEDTGKFGFKFQKKKKQGNWSGGGKASPGAQWSAAYDTTATVLASYFSLVEEKRRPKTIGEFLEKLDALAPKIKEMVDKRAGTATEEKKDEGETAKTTSESGESPSEGVVIDDVKEDDLGTW